MKQPKCPSTEECGKHICNGVLLSHKEEQNRVICRDVDGPRDVIQNELSQKEKNKYGILKHICGI